MSQHLPAVDFQNYGSISKTESVIDKVLNIHDCSDNGYELKIDIIYPDNKKEKSENFSFCPEKKVINLKKFTEYKKELVPKSYTPTSKLLFVIKQITNSI